MKQMDILTFLDSPAIREYNRDTAFTPAEQAVLVCQSMCSTIEDKIAALQYLVDAYEEEAFLSGSIAVNQFRDEKNPLRFRKSVESQIGLWKQMLEERFADAGAVYGAALMEQGCRYDGTEYRFYSCYELAYQALQRERQEYMEDEDLREIRTFGVIRRIVLDRGEFPQENQYVFDENLRLVMLWEKTSRRLDDEEGCCDLASDCYVHVPLPFQPGDLVKSVSPFYGRSYYGVFAIPQKPKTEDRRLRDGYADVGDMAVSIDVYVPELKKYAYTDDTAVLSLVFCETEDLPEKEREALVKLSRIRKGEIDLAALF